MIVYIIIIYICLIVKCKSDIALTSFRFGLGFNESMPITNRDYFLTHLRSISTFKNTTFLYFTDHIETKLPFPANVKQILITWDDLVSKLEAFVGKTFPSLRKSNNYYKLCDFKPLMVLLYPKYFSKYELVGWIDNDLWFSSELERFILYYYKKVGYSQLSLVDRWEKKLSWGPISVFTLKFYNTYINDALRTSENRKTLIKVFDEDDNYSFTEWGFHHHEPVFHNSFSRVLLDIYNENPNIKRLYLPEMDEVQKLQLLGIPNDRPCHDPQIPPENCGYCLMVIKNGETLLYLDESESTKRDKNMWKGKLMCHFQYGKEAGRQRHGNTI